MNKRLLIWIVSLLAGASVVWGLLVISAHKKGMKVLNTSFDKNTSEMLAAAMAGDDKGVANCLSQGVNINTPGETGAVPLVGAILGKSKIATRILLEHGADPNLVMTNGLTPMEVAALDLYVKDPEYLEMLLKHGGNPNLIGKKTNYAVIFTAISIGSVSPAKVKLLVEAGADTNAIGEEGCTPMTAAAAYHSYEIVYYLLQKGVDPAIKDKSERTILNWIQHDHPERPDPTGYREKVTAWLKEKNLWKETKGLYDE